MKKICVTIIAFAFIIFAFSLHGNASNIDKYTEDSLEACGADELSEYLSDETEEYLKKIGFSTSLITKVKFGGVSLNGTAVTMRALVKNGDKITVVFPNEESEHIEPIDIPLDILYEDSDEILTRANSIYTKYMK